MANQGKIVIAILVLVLLGIGGYFVYKNNTAVKQLVGNDRDVHGCIGSAGYSWCEAKQKCLRAWEEPCTADAADVLSQSSIDEIKQLLADRRGSNVDDAQLDIIQQTATHMRGGVQFAEQEIRSIVLAAQINGIWQIAFDGYFGISCQAMEPYDFPADMISDCENE